VVQGFLASRWRATRPKDVKIQESELGYGLWLYLYSLGGWVWKKGKER
jgi:hypothetical protein